MSIVTDGALDVTTGNSADNASNAPPFGCFSDVRPKSLIAHCRRSVVGLAVIVLGSLGCSSADSSFDALQRAFPVSSHEVQPQRLLIDGQDVEIKTPPVGLKYAVKAPITIAGTIAENAWMLGGTFANTQTGDFAWCPSEPFREFVEISSVPHVTFICKVHHLRRWTPTSIPSYALCRFRPHPLRNGGHFEVHLVAPPKSGDYAIDVSAEIHHPRTESPATDIPPKVSVFFRAKLRVD